MDNDKNSIEMLRLPKLILIISGFNFANNAVIQTKGKLTTL